MTNLRAIHIVLLLSIGWLALSGRSEAAVMYRGQCDVRFEADSTLHAFTGDITNIAVLVRCDTNAAGEAMLNTRLEISPKQLTTHHEKRDANMYKMFQSDRFPKLFATVTNAPLAAARLTPTTPPSEPGTLTVQLTFCGITKAVAARTLNPKALPEGWEFDLQMEISLKTFQLKPSSALFGMISVDDKVVIKAHVKVMKETTHGPE
jgi:polyisoprenoid-binding protein YceI